MGDFFSGLAGAFAQNQRTALEDEMQQRAQAWNLHAKLLEDPNLRDEARIKVLQNMGTMASLPMHKPISKQKQLTDMSFLIEPPAGYGKESPTQAPDMFSTGSTMTSPGSTGQEGAMSMPLGGGEGKPHGSSLPVPGPGLAGPEYAMTSQPSGQGPMLGMGPFSAPPPPAYSPFYSPEERSQMASAAETQLYQGRTRGEIEARRATMPQGLSPEGQAAWLAGRAPLIARLQTKDFVDKKGLPIRLSFDNINNVYYDANDNPVDPAQEGYQPVNYSTAATTPFKAFYQAGLQSGKTAQEVIDEWNTTHRETSAVRLVAQPDGTLLPFEFTTGTTTTRGSENKPPEPPKSSITGKGEAVGGKALTPVTKAYQDYDASIERYDAMSDAYPKALAGDQQAMLNLLANHIGMTMGLQKGSRITQAIYNEALEASPWLARLAAKFDDRGYLTGVVLTPDQMRQMLDLGKVRRDLDKSAYERMQEEAARGFKPPAKETPAAAKPSNSSHRFSKSAWKRANPTGDIDAAVKAATEQGYEVVP